MDKGLDSHKERERMTSPLRSCATTVVPLAVDAVVYTTPVNQRPRSVEPLAPVKAPRSRTPPAKKRLPEQEKYEERMRRAAASEDVPHVRRMLW